MSHIRLGKYYTGSYKNTLISGQRIFLVPSAALWNPCCGVEQGACTSIMENCRGGLFQRDVEHRSVPPCDSLQVDESRVAQHRTCGGDGVLWCTYSAQFVIDLGGVCARCSSV